VEVMHQAFEVEGEPSNEGAPPCDGTEYLRRVRKETRNLPAVIHATITLKGAGQKECSLLPSDQDFPPAPHALLPCPAWEQQLLSDFAQLRCQATMASSDRQASVAAGSSDRQVPVLPHPSDASSWETFCLGCQITADQE